MCFIVIYSHKYVNLLHIIIKDIEIEKVRCIFRNSWNDIVVSGFEVIALDDGIFPRSMVEKLYLFMSYSWNWQLSLLKVLYNYMFNYLNTILTVYDQNSGK